MFRTVLLICLALFAWVGLHITVSVITGLNMGAKPSDVAVVLGTRVLPSGVPSIWLRRRLDRGLELYRNGTVKNVIVSGGFGREGHEEADVMRDYLVERGVTEANVLVDRDGYDTYETARGVKELMAEHGFQSVVIVSHYYHVPRAVFAFKRFGISNVSATAVNQSPLWRDGGNLLREFAAFYFYLLRP